MAEDQRRVPEAELHRIDDLMDQYVRSTMENRQPAAPTVAQEIMGSQNPMLLADHPEHQKALTQAQPNAVNSGLPLDPALEPSLAAQQEVMKATQQSLDPNAPGSLNSASHDFQPVAGAGSSPGASASSEGDASRSKSGAEKPTDLESTIAAIRLDSERQKRFVILGDQDIKNAFMRKLEARGQVYYSGGSSVITISRAKALATLQEVTAERDGTVVHAATLKMDREGGGPMVRPTGWDALKVMSDNIRGSIDSLKAGVKNVIGRQHEIDVVVVGSKETVDAKLDEVGKFISDLDSKKLLKHAEPAKQDAPAGDAKEAGKATDRVSKVDGDGAGSAAGQLSLKDLGRGPPLELVGTSTLSDVLSRVQDKVNAYHAEKAAQQATLKEHEQAKKLQKMEDDTSKQLGAGSADKPESVNRYAKALSTDLADGFRDTATLAQATGKGAQKQTNAEKLLHTVGQLKDSVEREFQTLPEKDRHQALVHIAALAQKADSKEFGDKAQSTLDVRDAKSSATPRENLSQFIELEAKRTPDMMAKLTPLVQELVSSQAITEAQAKAVTEQFQTAASKVAVETMSAASVAATPTASAGTSSAPAAEVTGASAAAPVGTSATSSLRDTFERVAAAGPDKLSTEQAHALVASLEALRGKPLAALDDAKGDSPTQTLVRVEGVLQALGRGAQGDELNAKALELTEPLRQWKQQDALRYVEADGSVRASRPEVVALTKAAERQWHAGPMKDAVRFEDPGQPAKPAATEGSSAGTSSSGSPVAMGAAPSSAKEGATPLATEAGPVAAPAAAASGTETGASKPMALRDSLEQMAAAGPDKLSVAQAENLVAALDAIRTKPLAALDAAEGHQPTQTLTRIQGLMNVLERGELGRDLKAQAGDLVEPLRQWEQQDAQRYAKAAGAALGSRDEVVSKALTAEAAWHDRSMASGPAATSGTTPATSEPRPVDAPAPASAAGSRGVPPEASIVSAPSSQDLAAQRLVETEAAGGKLAMMMSNPPGSFTNRDKSWNEANIQKAAQEVLKLDPESVEKLSTGQVTKLAAYSYWLADKASSGRLPGFDTPEGKALADQVVQRAGDLLAVMDAKVAVAEWPKDVAKDLKKADNMVESREKLDQMSAGSSSSQGEAMVESTAKGRGISPNAARSLATELIDSVYRAPEITETQAKYLLKNAVNLTPESLKSLDSQTQAKTAVALSELTEQVRNGAMGEVSQLPGSVQKHLVQAEGAVDKLMSELNKSSGLRQSLQVARSVLDEKLEGPASDSTLSGPVKESGRSASAGNSRGLDLSR